MMIDDFHQITAAKPVLGNVAGESNVSIEIEAHGSYFSGIKVMNFVTLDNFSCIQMERTFSVTPFGPLSGPRIW
jgi:hypothetical protein